MICQTRGRSCCISSWGQRSSASARTVWFVYATDWVVMDQASSQSMPASSMKIRMSSGITRAGWVSLIWMTFFSWKFFRVPYMSRCLVAMD